MAAIAHHRGGRRRPLMVLDGVNRRVDDGDVGGVVVHDHVQVQFFDGVLPAEVLRVRQTRLVQRLLDPLGALLQRLVAERLANRHATGTAATRGGGTLQVANGVFVIGETGHGRLIVAVTVTVVVAVTMSRLVRVVVAVFVLVGEIDRRVLTVARREQRFNRRFLRGR